YLRFFSAGQPTAQAHMENLCQPTGGHQYAIVALIGTTLVAVANWEHLTIRRADIAVLVADAYQGHGIGTRLVWALVSQARHQQIHALHADVLDDNHAALRMLAATGARTSSHQHGNAVHLILNVRHSNRGA